MKKAIISLSGILISMGVAFLFLNDQKDTALVPKGNKNNISSIAQTPITFATQEQIKLPNKILPLKPLPSAKELGLNLDINEEQQNSIGKLPAQAWVAQQPDTIHQPVSLHSKITTKKRVAFNTTTMGSVNKGDKFSLPMPNGEEYVAQVETTTTFKNGTTSWQGHLEGYGDKYPVVFTVGKKTSFATVTTPDGSFTMESIDGAGWIYENPEVTELSDPNQQDSLAIPETVKTLP